MGETDLISRQAAIDALEKSGYCYDQFLGVESVLNALPSAQPEIIRCKDCEYYEIAWLKADGSEDKRYKPSMCVHGKYGKIRKPDWYCADAERRTDETD